MGTSAKTGLGGVKAGAQARGPNEKSIKPQTPAQGQVGLVLLRCVT